MYDFNTIIDRAGTGSIKLDAAPEPVKGSCFVPLTIADMEFATAPAITRAIQRAAEHGIYGYTYADNAYFNAVKSWQSSRHCWDVFPEWLTTTAGVVSALGIAVRSFTEPGEGVIIQPPVYPPFASSVLNNGRRLVENPLLFENGGYKMDYANLERKCTEPDVKLMLLCSPHNPVGRVWSREELARVADICHRNGVIVVSDEIHNDLIMPGNTHTVFAKLPNALDNCIVCTAVSKTFNLAGLSCSNIFIPNKQLRERFSKRARNESGGCVPYFARAATIAAYTEGAEWLDSLITTVDNNFKLMYRFVEEHLPELSVIRAEGTYLAWMDMRSLGLDNDALEALMLKGYLALDEGYIFGTNGGGFERWNLAMPTELLHGALERLEAVVRSQRD